MDRKDLILLGVIVSKAECFQYRKRLWTLLTESFPKTCSNYSYQEHPESPQALSLFRDHLYRSKKASTSTPELG